MGRGGKKVSKNVPKVAELQKTFTVMYKKKPPSNNYC